MMWKNEPKEKRFEKSLVLPSNSAFGKDFYELNFDH